MTKRKRSLNFNIGKALIIALSCILWLGARQTYADTINMKDGSEIKGIVLEEYEDRVTISTVSGEKEVMKSDIGVLYYDDEEKAYLKLAEKARDRGDYETSFAYYEKIMAKDPDSKDGRQGLAYLQEHIYSQDEALRQDFITRHNLSDSGVAGTFAAKKEEGSGFDAAVRKSTGLTFAEKDSTIVIASVDKDSSAYVAGVCEGDILIALWTKLVSYMPLDRVIFTLAKTKILRLECTIERTIEISKKETRFIADPQRLIGAGLGITRQGLTVLAVEPKGPAEKAGLRQDDLIIAIDGDQTRYMPFRIAVRLIKDPKAKTVKLTIQRSVTVMRKADAI